MTYKEIEEKGYINAGILKQSGDNILLFGNADGVLKVIRPDNYLASMARLPIAEKINLDKRTIEFLSPIYRSKTFLSREAAV